MSENKKIIIHKKKKSYLENKQIIINCIGDSITYGVGSNTDPDDPLNEKGTFMQYHNYWEKNYNVIVNNYGQSGAFIGDYDIPKGYQPNDSVPIVNRCTKIDKNADIITIMGGVNDCQAGYNTKAEFGDLENYQDKNTNNFCGALRSIIENIKLSFPDALLIFLTPLKYCGKEIDNTVGWENHDLLKNYVNAINIICSNYHIPVIDLFTPDELNFCFDKNDPFIYGDRLHFGWKAHKILSDFIIGEMLKKDILEIK